MAYESRGNWAWVKTYNHLDAVRTAITEDFYDFAGRLVRHINPEGYTTFITYTIFGAVASETNTMGGRTTYEYDKLGRLTAVNAPFEGSYQAKTSYTYDKVGNMLSKTTKTNKPGAAETTRKTTYTYDAWSRQTMVTLYEGTQPVSYIQTDYNVRGEPVRVYKGLSAPLTIVGLDDVTPNGDNEYSVIKTTFDYLGNPVEIVDAMGNTETIAYNLGGQVVSVVDKNGDLYEVQYDALNRKVTETNTGTSEPPIIKTFTYDNVGNLLTASENGQTETYTYDGRGRRLSETAGTVVKSYTYDNAGAMLHFSIEDNGICLNEVDNTYDVMGRLVSVDSLDGEEAAYSYDRASRLTFTEYANGASEQNMYNQAGLVTRVTNRDGDGNVVSRYSYEYLLDGNQLSKTDLSGKTSYTYDGLNRLKTVTYPDSRVDSYTFDDNGNRLSKITVSEDGTSEETYTYDKNDRLLTKTDEDGTTAYTYDNNGNMTGKSGPGVNVSQSFDLLNRMTSWTDGTSSAVYTYNVNNMRASKMVDGVTTQHIWIGDEIAVDVTGGSVVNYIHGNKLIRSGYGTYLYNAHGDVVQLLDDDGEVIRTYDYDPFGIELTENPSDPNPYRFSGEYLDLESGYVYLRARYYDPAIGRFISQDAVKDGYNWYVYCNNNPLLYVDPSGNIAFIPALVGAFKVLPLIAKVITGIGGGLAISTSTYIIGGTIQNELKKGIPLKLPAFVSSSKYIYDQVFPVDPRKYQVDASLALALSGNTLLGGTDLISQELLNDLGNVLEVSKKDKAKGKTKQPSKESDKERATDVPSWAKGKKPKEGQNGKDFAEETMNDQYGKGKWKGNPNRNKEYSELKKYGDRGAR